MTSPTPSERAEGLVSMFLDVRFEEAGEPLGLREAVVDRLAQRIAGVSSRLGEQIDHLSSSSSDQVPDAYLADEEAVEDDLQTCAAGIRAATAMERLVPDPRRFERDLAHGLAPDALWALRSEASRVPRPSTRTGQLEWSLLPIPWVEKDIHWPPAGSIALAGVRQLARDEKVVRVGEQPYEGWVQLGMFEQQKTLATRHPDIAARRVLVTTGLEICEEQPPTGSMPFSQAAPDLWVVDCGRLVPGLHPERARRILSAVQGPLVAIVDYEGQPGAPAHNRGIGLQRFTLVPRVEVIALLGLRPETPALRHVLVDDNGPAIVGRQWRGFLVHDGNFSTLEPAVRGADLIIRPDLYHVLAAACGEERLALGVTASHREVALSPHEIGDGD
ncbi:hypothetical protein AB0H12_38350 [Actinosynnema sp. NPDC023794]